MHSIHLGISIIVDDELSMKTKKFLEYRTQNYNEGCSYQENKSFFIFILLYEHIKTTKHVANV